jgi:hypothetical protein
MVSDHPEPLHKSPELQHRAGHDLKAGTPEGSHGTSAEINLLNLQNSELSRTKSPGTLPGGEGGAIAQKDARAATGGGPAGKPELAAVEQHILEALKKDSGNLPAIYQELGNLKSAESASKFSQDLSRINSDLQKNGLLPQLEIVQDKDAKEGFSLKQRKSNDSARPLPEQERTKPDEPKQNKRTQEKDGIDHSGEGRHHSRHSAGAHHGHGRHHARAGHRRHHAGRISHGRAHHRFEDGAYDGVKEPDQATLADSIKTVLAEAKAAGLNDKATRAAIASMLVESKGNPQARGDGNTSFGLFQLHRGGELTEALRRGLLKNENEAFDPAKNAHVALSYFKQLQGSISDPGRLAAASQRPKHRGEYADKVNQLLSDGTVDNLIKKYGSGS